MVSLHLPLGIPRYGHPRHTPEARSSTEDGARGKDHHTAPPAYGELYKCESHFISRVALYCIVLFYTYITIS
jgi:hypothetical protein